MQRITFRGHSDDTFGWTIYQGSAGKVNQGDDHDDCAANSVRTVHITSAKHGTRGSCGGETTEGVTRMAVTGVYGLGCMWSIGIAPIEDDDSLPDWLMLWDFEGYSTVLTIEAPDDAVVTLEYPEVDDDD